MGLGRAEIKVHTLGRVGPGLLVTFLGELGSTFRPMKGLRIYTLEFQFCLSRSSLVPTPHPHHTPIIIIIIIIIIMKQKTI